MLAALAAPPLGAEVRSVSAHGFEVGHRIETAAAPEAVFQAATGDIARWWDTDHSWSGEATNLYFDVRPGGCFCERLPDAGGVEYLRIVYLAPGREIRMQGALGPLQPMGLQGTMTWQFEPSASGSVVTWRYMVHGHLPGGFEALAPSVGGVIEAQLNRLGAYLQASRATPPD